MTTPDQDIIPIIEIRDGWTVDDVKTIADCDDAFAYLTGALCAIEARMSEMTEMGENKGEAFRRLCAAARWKRAALNVVNTKRGQIQRTERAAEQKSKDRALLDEIKRMYPNSFFEAVASLEARQAEDTA